jgi:hypothetical protein
MTFLDLYFPFFLSDDLSLRKSRFQCSYFLSGGSVRHVMRGSGLIFFTTLRDVHRFLPFLATVAFTIAVPPPSHRADVVEEGGVRQKAVVTTS